MLRERKTKYILEIFDFVANKSLSEILSSHLNLHSFLLELLSKN